MGRHILILNERDLDHPRAGGAEIHMFEVFGRLATAGDRVTMLCAGFRGGAAETTIAGVNVRRLGKTRRGYYLRIVSACRRYLAVERPDVLVEAHNKLPFLSPLYTRVPRLIIVHHLFGTTAFQQVPAPVAAVVVAAEWLIPRVYKGVSFIAISQSSRDDMVRRGLLPDRIRVVLCGVDHARYRVGDGTRAPQPLAVFVGRIETYKRLDVLLRAFGAVCDQGVDARLVIAGTGDALDRVRQLVDELDLGGRVDLPGFVTEEEKVRLLQQAHAVVQPSDKEGWGLTVIEANACGTPVIAADAPGLRDSVRDGETGLLVPPGDEAALAAALRRLFQDPALRERLGTNAVSWASGFRWDTAAQEIGAAIDAACGRCGGHAEPRSETELSLSIRSPERAK
jgi:glycosyltransferase involved in cell wall biosynthesis